MRVSKEQREALRRKAGDCAAYWPGPWGRTEGSRVIDATGVLIAVVHGWPEAAPYITAADPETITALLDDLDDAEQRAERTERERDAYRKAKQENDERFQIAAAEQRERAERAEAELAALRERVRLIEARTKREATEFVRRAGRARVASDEARALDEAGDALDDVCAGLRAVADAAPCHCGRPVAYGYDGDPTHHRRMCADCDAVRCDAYPMECPHRADLLDDDTTGAASGEGEK